MKDIKEALRSLIERDVPGRHGAVRLGDTPLVINDVTDILMAYIQMVRYAKELEDEIEDYHPADLQPVVTRAQAISRCRGEHGITDEMMKDD